MAVLKGNCYLCGRESGKTAIKNHILKEHSEDSGQECRLLKIEGAYNKNYWLYVDIPVTSNLSTLDNFLREIWLECCGHLSAFSIGRREIGMTNKIRNFDIGDVLQHEYDFGSPTDTLITVVGTIYRKQQRGVRLLARNVPMTFVCRKCGAPAEFVDPADYENEDPYYCEKCVEETCEIALPITNSPRMGVCGYCGELDTFEFIPKSK